MAKEVSWECISSIKVFLNGIKIFKSWSMLVDEYQSKWNITLGGIYQCREGQKKQAISNN